jgi:catecholate siderophore receptor
MALPHAAFAKSLIVAQALDITYSIPAGSLEDALNRFARQAGITISFAAADLKGATTQGLKGNYSIQGALERFTAGGDLQAARRQMGTL